MALQFQQPNVPPAATKEEAFASTFGSALQQVPSIMMQYQKLKQDREIQSLTHDLTKKELALKLKQLETLYGTGEAPPVQTSFTPSTGPGATLAVSPKLDPLGGVNTVAMPETEEQKLARIGTERYKLMEEANTSYSSPVQTDKGTEWMTWPKGTKPGPSMPNGRKSEEPGTVNILKSQLKNGIPPELRNAKLNVIDDMRDTKPATGEVKKTLNVPGYQLGGDVEPTETEARQAREALAKRDAFITGIRDLRSLVAKYGSTNLIGQGSAEAGTIASELQLTLKELQQLGVLSASDEMFLQAQITNPDSLKSIRMSDQGTLNQLDTTLNRMNDKFDKRMASLGYKKSESGDIKTIMDQSAYDALPSGATYIDPNGVTRRKK